MPSDPCLVSNCAVLFEVWYRYSIALYHFVACFLLVLGVVKGSLLSSPHLLDIQILRKGRDPNFDFRRLPFVQEAAGRQTEELISSAQSSVNNARKNSIQAAYNLFATNLKNDQILHDKFVAASEMSSLRARSVMVHSLEDRESGCLRKLFCDPAEDAWDRLEAGERLHLRVSANVGCDFAEEPRRTAFKGSAFKKKTLGLNFDTLTHTLQTNHCVSFWVSGAPSERAASVFAAKCEPWLQETLAGFGQGIRRPDADRIIVWCNYVPAGVVSSRQHAFTVEQITQACHANPRTACAVVLFPNRAGDLRSSPTKPPGYQVSMFLFSSLNVL